MTEPDFDRIKNMFASLIPTNQPWWAYLEDQVIENKMSFFSSGVILKGLRENKEVYEFSRSGFVKDFEELYEYFKSLDMKLFYKYNANKNAFDSIHLNFFLNETTWVSLAKPDSTINNYSIYCTTLDNTIYEKLLDFCKSHPSKTNFSQNLYIVLSSNGNRYLKSIGKQNSPFIASNYEDVVVNEFNNVKENFFNDKPFGRLLVIHGESGTGKTNWLQSLIYEVELENVKFVYISPDLLFGLDPSALNQLLLESNLDGAKLVLVIEDADECLAKRATDNYLSVSKLLNLADGFLGNMLDLRIIATTNVPKVDIDPAVKRPGRLFSLLEIGKLSTDVANEAYKRISKNDSGIYTSSQTLAQIYADALKKSNNSEKPVKKVGFTR